MMTSLADTQPDLLHIFADAVPLDKIDQLPSPRVIKTHLPLSLLSPKLLDTCKVCTWLSHHCKFHSCLKYSDLKFVPSYFWRVQCTHLQGHIDFAVSETISEKN